MLIEVFHEGRVAGPAVSGVARACLRLLVYVPISVSEMHF